MRRYGRDNNMYCVLFGQLTVLNLSTTLVVHMCVLAYCMYVHVHVHACIYIYI